MTPRLFGISMGWVPAAAGPVWMVLSVGMGIAAWLLFRADAPRADLHGWVLVGFIALCWMHPLYTSIAAEWGRQDLVGLIGAVVTLVVALGVIAVVRRSSSGAVALMTPVVVWLGLATVYLAQLVRHDG